MKVKNFIVLLWTALALNACDTFRDKNDRPPLEGKRLSVMELQKKLEPETSSAEQPQTVTLPQIWKNSFWPQSGGYPNHSMQNLALNEGQLKPVWKTDIGRGSTARFPLTSQPIVVGNQIFTLDTDFNLRAFDIETGKQLWRTDISNENEEDPVITGGIAYGEKFIFVTNGYNEVLSVNPKDGSINWRKPIPTPSRAAPTIIDGRVFVTTLDNRLIALSADEGALLWEYIGLTETAALVGAASPAASRDIVVPVFSSGEVTALRVENGSVAWSDNLAPVRRFAGITGISDIKALPAIDNGIVYAISFGGRLAAIDQRTGTRLWQRDIGGANTPWIAGDHLYVVTADNDLVALNRTNGVINWVTPLPKYEDPEDKSGVLFWTGPLLAGGRLIVASNEGNILEFSAQTGEQIRAWDTRESVVLPPLVAGETLYILSEDGTLTAYR